jgi:hypothetical protein
MRRLLSATPHGGRAATEKRAGAGAGEVAARDVAG